MPDRLQITEEWNGLDAAQEHHVRIEIEVNHSSALQINIEAPYYGDPPPTKEEAASQLWNFEVVEIFILGKDDKYLEIEVSPHGHALVLAFHGSRNCLKNDIPLSKVQCQVNELNSTWAGIVEVPIDLLPPHASKINAYAIHGPASGPRHYYALYPADPSRDTTPDFHRLEYFQHWKPIDNRESNFWAQFTGNTA